MERTEASRRIRICVDSRLCLYLGANYSTSGRSLYLPSCFFCQSKVFWRVVYRSHGSFGCWGGHGRPCNASLIPSATDLSCELSDIRFLLFLFRIHWNLLIVWRLDEFCARRFCRAAQNLRF